MACEYVGIDLHRRRSVIVRQDRDGEVVKGSADRQRPGRARV